MNKVISSERIPIKLWLDDIEEEALKQAINLANLPFAFKHVALMPDAHKGYGMCIGGVLATRGVIIPNAVGVDIGCGMCAVKTPLTEINSESLKRILGQIRETIPVGFKHHKYPQYRKLMPEYGDKQVLDDCPIIEEEYLSALKQIGTLGSGKMIASRPRG